MQDKQNIKMTSKKKNKSETFRSDSSSHFFFYRSETCGNKNKYINIRNGN